MQHDEESRYTNEHNEHNNNYRENDDQSQYQPPPPRSQGSSKPPPAPQSNRRFDQPDQQTICCGIGNFFTSFIFPHENPGKSGTYKGFFLLMAGILVSIICLSYPDSFGISADCPVGYEYSCQVANIVLRFSFAMVCLFLLNMIGTAIYTPFYDMWWIIKYGVFAGICVGFFFASGNVFGTGGYAWFARIGGFFFLIYQQIILVDFAYSWNERWVTKAAENHDRSGSWYLYGLVIVSLLLIFGAISMIGVMFWQFGAQHSSECSDTVAIIALTLVLSFFALMMQIFVDEHYSLLTSAIVFAYATYICYAAVSIYPNSTCNPTLSTNYQILQQIIGMIILFVSLIWTTKSSISNMVVAIDQSVSESQQVSSHHAQEFAPYYTTGFKMILLEISGVYVLISCYYAMILTNWATLQSGSGISSPQTGTSSFWLQISAQWVCLILYIWTLVAPKLFPDRDFTNT